MDINWHDFGKIDLRAGTIIEVIDFPTAIKPAWRLRIDFGEAGIKKSSAQIKAYYTKEDLVGKQVVAVLNFPPKNIGGFMSECLVLGVYDENKNVVLLKPERTVTNGMKIG
jgi:tRNA-binding protein